MAPAGPTHFHYEVIDSTNEEALRLLKNTTPPFFVTAARQTAGRGRQGRAWHSPEGNLYCTAAFPADVKMDELPLFTLYAALRICHALVRHTGAKLWLKWPNDLWIGKRKCAGLLAEAPVIPNIGRVLILGVGLNVNTKEFPGELSKTATSLERAMKKTFSLPGLGKILTKELMRAYDNFSSGKYMKDLMLLWERYGKLVGKNITFEQNGKARSGKVMGLGADGALCLKTGNTLHALRSGEVTLSKFLH